MRRWAWGMFGLGLLLLGGCGRGVDGDAASTELTSSASDCDGGSPDDPGTPDMAHRLWPPPIKPIDNNYLQ